MVQYRSMVDLLKGHNQKSKSEIINTSDDDTNKGKLSQNNKLFDAQAGQKNKTDLRKYKDPEGLSVNKLNFGLWLIKKRHFFYQAFIGILILISILTWTSFIWTFGSYIFFGMKADNQMLYELSQEVVHPEVIARQSPSLVQIGNLQVIKNHNGNYDFVLEAFNPNAIHNGIFDFYVAVGGGIIGESQARMLPLEKKYFLILNKEYSGNPNQIKFFLKEQNWQRINTHIYPNWEEFYQTHYEFDIKNEVFTTAKQSSLSEKLQLNSLQFDFHNKSAYNYWQIKLNIILSSRGKIVGVNTYDLNEILSGENRHVQIYLVIVMKLVWR